MKKGTKIHYKGTLYNDDGDRPVNLGKSSKPFTEADIKAAFEDKELKFLHVDNERIYGIDKLKLDDKYFLLLEPNPVTFYFSLAFDSLQQIDSVKIKLKEILSDPSNDREKAQTFSFLFRVSSVCTIFSFLALEAFLNQCLPDYRLIEFKEKMIGKKKIQNDAYFNDKFNDIIPKLLNKNFSNEHPDESQILMNLKKLRDSLIHLKEVRDGFTAYNGIYQEMLECDFKKVVSAVKECINFYSPDLIETYNLKTQIK
jgi:hypothetical protein